MKETSCFSWHTWNTVKIINQFVVSPGYPFINKNLQNQHDVFPSTSKTHHPSNNTPSPQNPNPKKRNATRFEKPLFNVPHTTYHPPAKPTHSLTAPCRRNRIAPAIPRRERQAWNMQHPQQLGTTVTTMQQGMSFCWEVARVIFWRGADGFVVFFCFGAVTIVGVVVLGVEDKWGQRNWIWIRECRIFVWTKWKKGAPDKILSLIGYEVESSLVHKNV